MPEISAGILLYRWNGKDLEILLVHPGGPFWKRKEVGAWSIPKGLCEPGEDPLETAKREFKEETGGIVSGHFIPVSPSKVHNKIIMAWAVEGDFDTAEIKSNAFSMEWPPKSGKTQKFPEVDRAAWFGLDEAREMINKGQVSLIDELECKLNRPD